VSRDDVGVVRELLGIPAFREAVTGVEISIDAQLEG
jgi:hypothetical protein